MAQQVGLFTPAVATAPNSSTSNPTYTYTSYQTSNFTVTAGAHTIEFLGLAPPSADSTAFIDNAAISAGCAVNDGGFEEPVLAANTYQVAPSGSGWQFAGLAGVSTNDSAFTAGNPNAPAGNQVAFLKQTGSISQSLDLAAGLYNISFLAAQRHAYQSTYETIEILVDGAARGFGHSFQHRVRLVRDGQFHGHDGRPRHRIPRRGPRGRRQHGFP